MFVQLINDLRSDVVHHVRKVFDDRSVAFHLLCSGRIAFVERGCLLADHVVVPNRTGVVLHAFLVDIDSTAHEAVTYCGEKRNAVHIDMCV